MKPFNLQLDPLTGRLSSKDTKKYFSTFGWFALVYFLATTLVQSVIVAVTFAVSPDIYGSWIFLELLSFLPNYCIGLPLAYFLLLRRLPKEIPDTHKMSFNNQVWGFFICMALMLLGNFVSAAIMTFFERFLGAAPENPVESSVSAMPEWATLLFVVIAAPILEELVFRRMLCRRLLPLGEGWAIVLSSAFFALFHGNFYQVFYAFTLGCFFSFIYVKTGRIFHSVIFHMLINFIGGFLTSVIYSRLEEYDTALISEKLYEALSSVNASLISANDAWGILWLGAAQLLSLFIYVSALMGAIMLICRRRLLKVSRGSLPPHEDGPLKLVTSAGIITCSIVFAFVLAASVMPA
jgi:membrane protease YdiL (CAAX protease family)